MNYSVWDYIKRNSDRPDNRSSEELLAARNAAIEECARAIDEAAIEADSDGWTACDYAGYIRALKDKP